MKSDNLDSGQKEVIAIATHLHSFRDVFTGVDYISWERACFVLAAIIQQLPDLDNLLSNARKPDKDEFLNILLQGLTHLTFCEYGSPVFLISSEEIDRGWCIETIKGLDLDGATGIVFFPNADESTPLFMLYNSPESGFFRFVEVWRNTKLVSHSGSIDNEKFIQSNACKNAMIVLSLLFSNPEFEDVETPTLRAQGFGKQKQKSSLLDCERAKILKPRILPINPVKVDHGGTHASPRPHDRRGHWRRKPKGDISDLIWVKSSKVGMQK